MKHLLTLPVLLLLASCITPKTGLARYRTLASSPETLPRTWIQGDTTFQVIEQEIESYGNGARLPAFDDQKAAWFEFKSKYQSNSVVSKWASPVVEHDGLSCYARGFCISLNGRTVAIFELIPICSQSK